MRTDRCPDIYREMERQKQIRENRIRVWAGREWKYLGGCINKGFGKHEDTSKPDMPDVA